MLSAVVGFVTGVAAALLANVLWLRRWRMRAALCVLKKPRMEILDFDPMSVGLWPVNRWSTARPLRRDRLRMQVVSKRPRQRWCDVQDWKLLAAEHRTPGKTADTAYLVDFEIDHHETKRGQAFAYSVAHCYYWEHLATVEYLNMTNAARSRIWQAFQRGQILDYARSAPPAAMKINVAVISPESQFLAIQRSGAVDHKKGLWTVGPNETMVLPPMLPPGTQAEDLFGLAERCVREEVGIEPIDYGPINISWIGFDVTSGQAKVYAQVRSHLPRREIGQRMASSHGIFEAQSTTWLPLSRKVVMDIMRNWESGDSAGRRWSASAPHALQELWRFRKFLNLSEFS